MEVFEPETPEIQGNYGYTILGPIPPEWSGFPGDWPFLTLRELGARSGEVVYRLTRNDGDYFDLEGSYPNFVFGRYRHTIAFESAEAFTLNFMGGAFEGCSVRYVKEL